jgi:hypothetical protein
VVVRYLATPLALFILVIFEVGFHIFAWEGLDCDTLIYASWVPGMTGMHHQA